MEFKQLAFIVVFILSAFAIQYYLGFKQITHFGDEYQKMRKEGKVAIGRRPGKITAGTLILFALDSNGRIRYGKKLQGSTVWAKFKDFDNLNGCMIANIDENNPRLDHEIKITKLAVSDAVKNYKLVRDGKQVPEKKSVFANISSVFKNKSKSTN